MNANPRRVAVLGGVRIPFARQNGPYARASNQDMLTATLDALVGKFGLEDQTLGEVAAGAVLKHSRDFNLTRESVLGSRLAPETPAYDVQQACGTGLEAAVLVANKIALGQIDSAIAGGVDTTSDAPLAINEHLREVLLEVNRAKSNSARLKALSSRGSALRGISGTMYCGRTLVEAQTAAVDHVHKREGLRRPVPSRRCSPGPGGRCRTSTTTRSMRRSPRRCVHAQGVGGPGLLPGAPESSSLWARSTATS